jgi:hypothetical protein
MNAAPTDRPAFLITVDTEGDNIWACPAVAETRNAAYLPRFQELCEGFGFKPTYLTNYEMARSPTFRALARSCIAKGTAEIGMHLHAWDTPPINPLTDADHRCHPYLIDFPKRVMREKIKCMTELLEDTFGVRMRSHRAGRWAFNETYAALLLERGYCVDCSVTPGHSWAARPGAPGRYGTNYANFPDRPYFMSAAAIDRTGETALLEVPMTIRASWLKRVWPHAYDGLLRPFAMRIMPERHWLRPNGANRHAMLALAEWAVRNRPYMEFMIHSSELMPGGSPIFRTEASVERLYSDLEIFFRSVALSFDGCTLSEFYDRWSTATAAAATHDSKIAGAVGA